MDYYTLFEDLIGKHLKDAIIYEYSTVNKKHEYHPFRHSCDNDAEIQLGKIMEKYIYFYAYSEEEVLSAFEKGRLDDLKKAGKFALKSRLPNRNGPQNGIYSELLLELLLTMKFPAANKLATRAIYRQMTDNNEIKGFDGLHIRFLDEKTELWLGQAKMGSRYYSISGIKEDLYNKMNMLYTSEQLYFVADKETKVMPRALEFLNKINELSFEHIMHDDKERAKSLNDFFVKENVELVLPCLLAYGSTDTYTDRAVIDDKVINELNYIVGKLDEEFEALVDIDYTIKILFIPIRELKVLRESMEV